MLTERPSQHVGNTDHLIVELDNLSVHVAAVGPGGQQLIRQLRSEHRCVVCFLEQFFLIFAVEPLFQELVVAGDHEEQVVEVVRDAAGQLPDGLDLLGLGQTLALPECFLYMPAIAEIMDHAGEIAPAIRLELADGQMQRKGGAVPAAAAHLAADSDDLLDAGRLIVGDVAIMLRLVGLRHEDLDVLADQFRRIVEQIGVQSPG